MIIRNHTPKPLELTEAQKQSIRKIFTAPSKPPSMVAKARHAFKATSRIVKAAAKGDPIRVTPDELKRRDSICNSCDLWQPSGNLGMGECKHPQCGCTKFKRGFATETCPAGKWDS